MFIQILDERTIEGTFNVQGKYEENTRKTRIFFPLTVVSQETKWQIEFMWFVLLE